MSAYEPLCALLEAAASLTAVHRNTKEHQGALLSICTVCHSTKPTTRTTTGYDIKIRFRFCFLVTGHQWCSKTKACKLIGSLIQCSDTERNKTGETGRSWSLLLKKISCSIWSVTNSCISNFLFNESSGITVEFRFNKLVNQNVSIVRPDAVLQSYIREQVERAFE